MGIGVPGCSGEGRNGVQGTDAEVGGRDENALQSVRDGTGHKRTDEGVEEWNTFADSAFCTSSAFCQ